MTGAETQAVGMELRRILRFLAVGGLNTAFGYAVYAGFLLIGLVPWVALLVATVIGVVFNFVTYGRLVFDGQGFQRFCRFVVAYALVYAVNAGLLTGIVAADVSAYLAQALLLPFAAGSMYVIQKKFVFGAP